MARFLIHKQGALLGLFQAALGPHELVEAKKSHKASDFDMVVIDAESVGAGLDVAVASARQAVDADKPVLVLRPGSAQKTALAAAGALGVYPAGNSVALLIDPYHDRGRLRFRLAEQYAPNQFGGRVVRTLAGQSARGPVEGPVDVFPVTPGTLPNVVDMTRFVERVRKAVTREAADSSNGPNNPPSNIPTGLYDVTPVLLYYPQAPAGNTWSGYTPPQGSLYFEGTVFIGVYYDNMSFNQAVQWLLIEHSGLYYTSGLEANDSTHVGWSVGELQIGGQNISGPTIVTKQSSPNNVNGETTYGSETSFSVGISAGTDGISANASYTIGSSVSNAISDWGIVQSSPDFWQFAQQTPYNGATPPGTFPSGAAGSGGVAGLPPISAGSLAFNTQTVWIQLPATNSNAQITFNYLTQSFFTYASETGKSWSAASWIASMPYSMVYALNWSAAWPS